MNRTIIDTRTDTTFNGNPFVGLRPFNSDEGLLFFGRQDQAAELVRKLHLTRFLGVVGSSGCGKSSLIRAGLIPKLKAGFLVGDRDQWRIAIMKPGDAPLRNLAISLIDAATGVLEPATTAILEETMLGEAMLGEAMLGEMDIASLVKSFRRTGAQAAIDYLSKHTAGSNYPGANLLLLVDQFEELFHFGIETGDPKKRDEAADFVAIMLELAEQRAFPIYVVMTMRSDYLGECDNFYGLPEALNRSQYLVPRLTRQQRQQAIEGPIRLFGEKIAPRLVDRVLNDVGDQSDQLPVMQHALMRTWDNWRHGGGGSIDCPHYEKAGTIKRALSDDADSALVGMSDEERKITERLFQALTNVDTRNRRVRRQTHLSELQEITGAGREQLLKVINRFRGEGRCFLNIEDDKLTDDPLVDISHESLIRQWKQLDIWLNDESDWSDIYVRLADDAERYKKSQVDLWRDPQLQIALNWFADRRPNKAWGERYHPGFDAAIAFMEKSRAEREAEAERERARREKDLADALELDEMRRKQLRRNRFFSIFLFLSLLSSLVAGGYTFQLKAQAESAKADLEKSNKALDEARKGEEERSERFKNLALTNSKLLTESESQKRDLEAAKFNLTKALQAAEKSAAAERASADLANRAADEAKKQSKISRQHLAQLLGLHSVHLAPKGENDGAALEKRALLAAQSLRIKADGGEALPTVEGDRAAREILALAPRIVKTQRVGEYGSGASFSQDAKTLAALTFSKEARLIDTFTGAIKPGAEKLPAGAEQILISPDGKYLAISQPASQSLDAANMSANVSQISGAARSDIRIQVIETASGRALGQPVNPGGSTPGSGSTLKMLFSPDGFRLVTLTNTEAQLWETTTGKAIGNQRPDSVEETTQEPKQPNQAQRTPNITSRSLYQKSSASSSSKAVAAAFSPDGKTLATIHTNDPPYTRAIEPTGITSRIYFWNVETGARAADPIEADAERKSFFSAVAYSPDGKYLLTVRRGFSTPALIELWNPQTGKLIAEPMGWPNCKSVVFNRNGDEAAVVTDANTVVKLTILNDGGRILLRKGAPIYYGAEPHAVAFSDDGNQLIVVSKEGEVTISETKAEPVVANIPAAENTAMAFNPNGGLLATEDGIRGAIWNSMTKQLTEIPLLNAKDAIPPMAMAFSNGGRFLATVSDLFRIWDFNESQPINRSVKPSDRIRLAAFSRNADYLVMVGENGAAVGVASSGEGMLGAPTPPMKLPGLGAATKAIAVSPAHPRENRSVRYLASTDAGEAGGVARIREVIRDETGRSELGASLIVRHGAEITAMTFFRRGSWVLVTAGGNAVKFWNAQTGNQIGQTVEHDGKVNDFGFRSNQVMVTACQDGKIVVWVIQPNQSWLRDMTMDFGGPAERIVFGGNGAFMTVAGAGKARVWNTSTWRQIGRDMNIGEVVDIAPEVNSRGRFLSVAGENGMCGVWRSEAGQQTASSFRCAGAKDKAFFSPDGRWLLTGSVSFPRVWNMEGMTQPAGWIPTTALSHDGKYLASSYGRTIRVHSATDLREIYSGSLNGNVTQLAFDPAGGLTVVSRKPALQAQAGNPGAATDENEDVWIIETRNAETGAVISKTPDRPILRDEIVAIAFSPTGDLFATLNYDGDGKASLVFWRNNASEFKQAEGKLIRHSYPLENLAFSPDGKFIVATGPEGAHIWEVATRQEVAEIPEARNNPAFSPDGKYLAVTSEDGIEVMRWRPDDLAEEVCARLKRNFTYDEWQQYIKDELSYERTCPAKEAHQTVIDEAINLAKEGRKAEAATLFKAMRDLKNKPEEEAEWHEAAAQQLNLINEKMHWRTMDPDGVEPKKRREYVGDPGKEAEIRRRLREAIQLFDDFKRLYRDPRRPHSFNPNRVSGTRNSSRHTPARILNGLCWYGNLFGFVDRVKDACDIAVELDPKFTDIIDSRGLAKALTGDLKGAIADFEFFARTSTEAEEIGRRRQWVEALKKCLVDRNACEFPFTSEKLKGIRKQ